MKKIVVLLMALLVVGCSSNRKEQQTTKTPVIIETPESTTVVYEDDFTESKINIDLYKADEYYPVVDGVVTYPDGKTEEFSNGELVPMLDGSETSVFRLYELSIEKGKIFTITKDDAVQNEYPHYRENINDLMYVTVPVDMPDNYNFVESSEVNNDLIDGVFGVEMIDKDGKKIPYVIYRYSTHIPKGYDINESFRIINGDKTCYIWRIKEYDYLKGFYDEVDGEGVSDRSRVLWWGTIDPDSFNPHLFTFR
ncbi:MAG: hypothetical protein ACK5KQ_01445 [Anaerorhabdus sp.]